MPCGGFDCLRWTLRHPFGLQAMLGHGHGCGLVSVRSTSTRRSLVGYTEFGPCNMIDLTEFFLSGKVPKITESDAFKRLQQKADSVQQKLAEQPQMQVELFPKPWSDSHAIGANTIVRSAVFGTFDRQEIYNKRDSVFSYENAVRLRVQGEALNQTDYDVFQILLVASAVCEIEAGSRFHFTRYSLMKVLGWPDRGRYYHRLDESLTRLASFVIDLEIQPCKTYPQGWRFNGSLIQLGRDGLRTDESMKNSLVRVNMHEELRGFFMSGTYHMENLEQRRNLGKNQLAKALHAFYSSHLSPLPIALGTLQAVVGASDQLPKHFKQQIKKALSALQDVGFLESWNIAKSKDGDTLYVVRAFSRDERALMKPKGQRNTAWGTVRDLEDEVSDFIYQQKQGLEILHESVQGIIRKP